MSSLAELHPELVGFFCYSWQDDQDSDGAVSALRERIQRELGIQLGLDPKTFSLWQDKKAIPYGALWEDRIKAAIAQSVFFIPIITPRAVRSRYCKFELDSFLAREAELDRNDLVFPIYYIEIEAFEDHGQRHNDPVLSEIAKRQYRDWREFRLRDVNETDVKKAVADFCKDIRKAVKRPWLSPEERKKQEEAEARRRAEDERQRREEEAKRREEETRQKAAAAEAQARERAEEERRRREAEAEAQAREPVEEEFWGRVLDEQWGREAQWRAEGRIKVNARIIDGAPAMFGEDGWFEPGAGKTEWFQDHEYGPEMVVVPAREFRMGSPENEPERLPAEGPLHKVTLARAFAVGRHALTRRQYAAFVNNTDYKMEGGAHVWTGAEWELDPNRSWLDPGFRQDDDHPVVCVNWDDARAYAAWLSQTTGHIYRLLSEAEWEYAARAGTARSFWWGSSITPAQANYSGNFVYQGGGTKGEYRQATVAAGSFEPNPWGLYNVHGNVWEWCEDCWHHSYAGAPSDGSAWTTGDCCRRVLRGCSWDSLPRSLRAAERVGNSTGSRGNYFGFRLGRTLILPLESLHLYLLGPGGEAPWTICVPGMALMLEVEVLCGP
jgi:formylglycine-generating enzyme required for sulfatase activity